MTASLVPCPGCSRHVRPSETDCPFCGNAVAAAIAPFEAPRLPRRQLPRAAVFAFGATVAGAAALSGCGDDDGGEEADTGMIRVDGATPPGDMGTPSPLYGAPAPDAGMESPDLGGPAPAYGAVPFDAGGGMNLYGAPPPPDNEDGGIAALYGAVPPPDGGD